MIWIHLVPLCFDFIAKGGYNNVPSFWVWSLVVGLVDICLMSYLYWRGLVLLRMHSSSSSLFQSKLLGYQYDETHIYFHGLI